MMRKGYGRYFFLLTNKTAHFSKRHLFMSLYSERTTKNRSLSQTTKMHSGMPNSNQPRSSQNFAGWPFTMNSWFWSNGITPTSQNCNQLCSHLLIHKVRIELSAADTKMHKKTRLDLARTPRSGFCKVRVYRS